MTILDDIKKNIKNLYETNPDIHINVITSYPKMSLLNEPARITGVYKNLFRLEEYSRGFRQIHTFQYSDILIKRIEIIELTKV